MSAFAVLCYSEILTGDAQEHDVMEQSLRPFVEECDNLQVRLLFPFSRLSTHALVGTATHERHIHIRLVYACVPHTLS